MTFERESRRLLILTYHRVPASPDPIIPDQVDSETFDRQMSMLARAFNVLPLVSACAQLRAGTLPPRAVSITFDDGYRDNYTVALPILRKYGFSATFFVTTSTLDTGRMWNDTVIEAIRPLTQEALDLRDVELGCWPVRTESEKRTAIGGVLKELKYRSVEKRNIAVDLIKSAVPHDLPDDLMMTGEQVRELAQSGMEVGGHTVNHPILERISDEQAEWEIRTGKKQLEELTGHNVCAFAYPNGRPETDYSERHVELVRKSGFACAVSTVTGLACRSDDCLQYPRISPWQRSRGKFLLTHLYSFWT